MTALPNAFKRIRLNLARSKEFPQGSSRHGYEFVAPLDSNSHIDAELWKRTGIIAVSDDFGKVRRMNTGFWSTSRAVGSMGAGCSTTTRLRIPMTRAVTARHACFPAR